MAQNEDHINTSDAEIGDVLVTITYPQGGNRGAYATLRIEDRLSGQALVQVDLDPEQFMRAIGSGTVYVSGAQLPAHPERIGRRMQNTSTGIHSHADGADAEAEQVRDAYLADGWEKVSIDRTNFGRRVRAYRWIAAEEG
jgi:hypothetical protein